MVPYLHNSTKKRPVQQIDAKSGKVLATFPSRSDAARYLNLKSNNIGHVLSGRQATAAGFAWRYAD
jgi:hypothetical protein